MKDYIFYGLFLTKESQATLEKWIKNNRPYYMLIRAQQGVNWYLDHCTVLHSSQDRPEVKEQLDEALATNPDNTILIDGIGFSNKAIAFRVRKGIICANEIPHITIATYNGSKPVDSNKITVWETITPIEVKVQLGRV